MNTFVKSAIGLAAVFGAQNAYAVTAVTSCGSGSGCAILFDGIAGTYGNQNVTNASFSDFYTFDVGNGLLSIDLSTSFAGLANGPRDIDFTLVRLQAPGGGGFTQVPLVAGTDETYRLSNLAVVAGQYGLRLNGGGTAPLNAAYSGTISFAAAAVPEPATWAMMFVGFGMVAGAARYRRRESNVRFA